MRAVIAVALAVALAPLAAASAERFDFEFALSGGGFIPMDRFEVEAVRVGDTVAVNKASDSSYLDMGPYAEASFALVPKDLYIPHALVFRAGWGNSKGLFRGSDSDGRYERELEANFCSVRWGLDVFLRRSGLRPYFGLFWGIVRAGLKIDESEVESYGGLISFELGARQNVGRFFLGAAIELGYGFELWFQDTDENRNKSYEIDMEHIPATARLNAGINF